MEIPVNLQLKYPHAATFLREHPHMSIDQAIDFLKKELENGERNKERNSK
jgi:hypothetical protein